MTRPRTIRYPNYTYDEQTGEYHVPDHVLRKVRVAYLPNGVCAWMSKKGGRKGQ